MEPVYPPECDDDIFYTLYGTRKEIVAQLKEYNHVTIKLPVIKNVEDKTLLEQLDEAEAFDRAMDGI